MTPRPNRDRTKIYYTLEWGKDSGQRHATGIYTYAKPKDIIQKNHNKEALAIIQTKKSQLVLDLQAAANGHIPQHKIKKNFLDYYDEYVRQNERPGNRSLSCSLSAFRKFINKDFITAADITENLCERFRNYLLDNLNGETPQDYFMRFRRVLRSAKKAGYFRENPAEDVKAKSHPSGKKEILSAAEYKKLVETYCSNHEVKKAAVFCLYTGLRWVDVSLLAWECIKEKTLVLPKQKKTLVPLEIPLHAIAKEIIGEPKTGLVFQLPTQDGANKVLGNWVKDAGIDKHIT